MSRYTYNSGLVTQTLEKLSSACDALDATNVDIQKGIDMIENARGAVNMQVDYSVITGYQSQVIEYIDTMSNEISNKAQEIEEYESAPWWKKLFATIGMGALKLVEGLATFVENIGDGLVSIVGFVGGIFSSDFRDSVGEFVKKDWVGDTTAQWYEEGWLKDVNKYSVMSHESTAANILKGVGTAAGYVILSVATAGAGTAVSLGVSTAAAAAGGIGSGTQSGLQAGMTFNQAFGQGVKQGAVSAATTLVVGGVANKLTAGARSVAAANSIDDLSAAASKTASSLKGVKAALANGGDEIAGMLDDVTNSLDEVATIADDAAMAGGTTVKSASTAFKSSKNLAKSIDDLKAAAQAAGYGDDVINSIDDLATSAKATSEAAKTAKSAVAGAQKFTDTKVGEKAGAVASKAKNVVKNTPVVGKAATKVASTAKNVLKGAATSKVGTAVTNVLTTAATKAGPVVTNAIAAGTGAVASGVLTDSIESTAYRNAMEAQEAIAAQQDTSTTTTPSGNTPVTNTSGESTTSTNTGGNITSTTTPSSTGGNTGSYSTGGTTSTGSTTASSTPVSTTPITGTEMSTPDIGSTGSNTSSNTSVPTTTPSNSGQTTDSIVGSANNIASSGTSNYTPTVGSLAGNTSISGGETDTSSTVASELADSFGNVSGSLSELTGGSSNMNIPTSSAPIVNSEIKTKSSMIPLGAGLGAAAISGIGAKAYMDRKENKKEDDEAINTDSWEEETEGISIDYGSQIQETSDYLSPTDEYAFQE